MAADKLISVLPIANGGTGQTGVTSTTTISSIVTAASGFTITSAEYYQWGKLAQIYVKAKKTTAVTSDTAITMGTLVSGKRPATLSPAVTQSSTIKFSQVTNAGELIAYGQWAANAEKQIVATFILP